MRKEFLAAVFCVSSVVFGSVDGMQLPYDPAKVGYLSQNAINDLDAINDPIYPSLRYGIPRGKGIIDDWFLGRPEAQQIVDDLFENVPRDNLMKIYMGVETLVGLVLKTVKEYPLEEDFFALHRVYSNLHGQHTDLCWDFWKRDPRILKTFWCIGGYGKPNNDKWGKVYSDSHLKNYIALGSAIISDTVDAAEKYYNLQSDSNGNVIDPVIGQQMPLKQAQQGIIDNLRWILKNRHGVIQMD